MTLVELSKLAAGYEWRTERAWDLAAWQTAHMLNVSGKVLRSRVTARQLLRRPIRSADQQAWWKRVEKQRAERKLLAEQAGQDAPGRENGDGD